MINIKSNESIILCSQEKCTGCSACVNSCPLDCIEMHMDEEGFLFPVIDEEKCKKCGICVNSCPVITASDLANNLEPDVYVCWNKNSEARKSSSSGGVFPLIAQSIIQKGGVVFGVMYDDRFNVHHCIATTEAECRQFYGSKYVQSNVGNVLRQVKLHLKSGKHVLFSGTPCQVAGLYSYLKKDYEKLLTCDFSCHGVPSPGVFVDYLQWQAKRYKSSISTVNFREKRGDNSFNLLIKFSSQKKYLRNLNADEFYRGFLRNILLRKSCYQCIFASVPRRSDITLGDFHGIEKLDRKYKGSESKGISLVLLNNNKGKFVFEEIEDKLIYEKRTLNEASYYNRLLLENIRVPAKRKCFFERYQQNGYKSAREVIAPTLKTKIARVLNPKVIYLIKTILQMR